MVDLSLFVGPGTEAVLALESAEPDGTTSRVVVSSISLPLVELLPDAPTDFGYCVTSVLWLSGFLAIATGHLQEKRKIDAGAGFVPRIGASYTLFIAVIPNYSRDGLSL